MSSHSTIQPLNQSPNSYGFVVSKELWAKIGLLVVIFLFSYFNTIVSLVRTWSGRDDYSHGFLIPFISLYFVWHKKEELRHIPIKPSIIIGFILMLIGGLMLLTGYIGSVIMVQQISILIVIPGVILALLGTNYLKALFLPLSYLIFMIPPILDVVVTKIQWPFQLFSAIIASKILAILNIPIFQRANLLELPNTTLEVASECSGVRYLISIIALGIPLSYFTQKNWRRRVLLIVFGIIIGILINPIRITLIGIWAYKGGEVTHGPYHIFQGLFVSVIGFVLLFILAWGLAQIPLKHIRESHPNKERVTTSQHSDFKQFNLSWLMAVICLLCLGSFMYFYKPRPIPLKAPLTEMPLMIGDWQGENISDYSKLFKIKGADYELSRVYKNSSGQEIKLQISYFESQRQDKELINDTLQSLYDNSQKIIIPINSTDHIQTNIAILNGKRQDSLVLYWYDLNGHAIANNYKAKFITAMDGLFHRRTNGALIMVSGTLNTIDKDIVLNNQMDFVQKLFPLLKIYLS